MGGGLKTKNLGFVQALFVGDTEPANKYCVWFDTTIQRQKWFNFNTSSWELFSGTLTYKGIATTTTPSPVSPQVGDFWKVGETGVVFGISVTLTDELYYNGIVWELLDLT